MAGNFDLNAGSGAIKLSERLESREETSMDRDEADMMRLGKKPVLKRRFGFMSLLGFSCTILITWEGVLIVFNIGFENGGPAGLVYQFLLCWIGTASVFACLSELASMFPTSGGQYYWVSLLAPRSSRLFFSYATGWLTVWGWQATLASVYYLAGAQIQGLITLTRPSYNPHPWHTVLLFWASMVFTVIMNTIIGRYLPKFEGFILIVHILGFFAILLPLAILGSHQSAHEVFTHFLNEGEWNTQGLSFMIGLIGSVYTFTGADGAIHMSEEIQGASSVVPRSIMFTILINGGLAFAMLIMTLFSLTDVEGALDTPTDFPFMAIFRHSTGSTAGATFMAAILVVMQFSANAGLLASASRMCWSFARDRGLPGWKYLQYVDPHSTFPIRSIIVTTIISLLLSLIILGSSVAFNDLVSLSVSGLQTSYLICISLLLYHRIGAGSLSDDSTLVETQVDTRHGGRAATKKSLRWGPFRIPGYLGIVNNAFACAYLSTVVFFSFWPTKKHVTAENMNYSILMTGGVTLFSLGYYVVWARKVYDGPVVETE